jgi:hypothetical protein
MRLKKYRFVSVLMLLSSLALAEDNNPSQGPHETKSYTLKDIYDRLTDGKEVEPSRFAGPGESPEQSTGHTLNEIMEKAPAVDSKAAEPEDVAEGKKYWGLMEGNWGLQTGTGTTGGGGIECSTGEDRFTDNGDGTVTDNCTHLIWLKSPNCFKKGDDVVMIAWNKYWPKGEKVNDKVNDKVKGGMPELMGKYPNCIPNGDANVKENWRLPSVKELQSLIDFSQIDPALPQGHPFDSVQSSRYWSSTEIANGASYAWDVNLYHGGTDGKSYTNYVWPVRSR